MTKFGYILDMYPTENNVRNNFLEYLKEETDWVKHFTEKDFEEEYLEIEECEVESYWTSFKELFPYSCEDFKAGSGTIPIYDNLPKTAYMRLRG